MNSIVARPRFGKVGPSTEEAERKFMPKDPTIIDPTALERLEGWGGTKLSREIVRLFLDHGPSRVDQIREAMEGEDLEVPERGAHSLKSSAANVGAEQLQSVASEIEAAASGGDLQLVRDLIPDLEQAYAMAAGELAVIIEGDEK